MKRFIVNTKIMDNGQITLPKEVLKVLGVSYGDNITFVVEENDVRIVNPGIYAMQELQKEMVGEAKRTNLITDEDVMKLVEEIRNEKRNT